MSDKITIRKLAAELSISRSTVHRALAGLPDIRPELRRRILSEAQKRGYILPGPKKHNIAILVHTFLFFGYLEYLLHALESEFHRCGFQIELIPTRDIDLLGNQMFDGIVSLVWRKGLEKSLPQKFAKPIITINAASNILETVPVIMSDPHGIRLALDYLHQRGCRKIFFVSAPTENVPDAALRLEEFRNFCLETGQDFGSMHQVIKIPEEIVPVILKVKPDACFCASENTTARIGLLLKKAGLRIPEDISLMGLDDERCNECFVPPITAIRQDFRQIAAVTAEKMYQAIINKIPPTCAKIPFRLIERESVRLPSPASEQHKIRSQTRSRR